MSQGSDNSKSWRHHYVPQFYLRAWARDGRVLRYQRGGVPNEIEHAYVSPRSTAFAQSLYSLESTPISQPDADGLEKHLAEQDSSAAQVHSRMLNVAPSTLTVAERAIWSRFMHGLVNRHPSAIADGLRFAEAQREEVLKRNPWASKVAGIERLFSSEDARNLMRAHLLARSDAQEEWAKVLPQWTWTVIRGPECFVTSDRPVLLNIVGIKRGELVRVVEVALSPSRLLLCTPPDWTREECADLFLEWGATFNGRLLEAGPRYLYSLRSIESISGIDLSKMLAEYLSLGDQS